MRRCPQSVVVLAMLATAQASWARSQPPVIHAFPETGYESRVWGVSGNGSFAVGESAQSESSDAKPFQWSLESVLGVKSAAEDRANGILCLTTQSLVQWRMPEPQ